MIILLIIEERNAAPEWATRNETPNNKNPCSWTIEMKFFFFLAHIVDFGLRKLWVYLTVFTSWDHFQAQCARLAHQKP
jgi:hypothetical protein